MPNPEVLLDVRDAAMDMMEVGPSEGEPGIAAEREGYRSRQRMRNPSLLGASSSLG
jgi:hypothetical protein